MQPGFSISAQIGALVVATSGIQLANGFFGTFFSLRVVYEGFELAVTGPMLSSYFAGFTGGAVACGRIIGRIGHIRAYAAFGGMVIAATAAMPLMVGALPWIVLRAVIGFGCAGIFVTTESWLNAKAPPAERSRVFAIYMVGTFAALGLGQLLIGRIDVTAATPFNLIVALFAVALVLVTVTRAEPPTIMAVAPLSYGQLFRAAPVAVAGAVLSGLIASTFYALVPAWMHDVGVAQATIGLFMLVAVLGGLAFQIPVGRLSDRFDRVLVLAALAAALAVSAIALAHLPRALPIVLPVAFLFGGLMSTLYPVCVANAHDRMPADRVVAVSGRLILLSGLGSVLGPLIGANLKSQFGIHGVLYLMAAAAVLLVVVTVMRSLTSQAPEHLERPFTVLAPQATALAHDPEGASEP